MTREAQAYWISGANGKQECGICPNSLGVGDVLISQVINGRVMLQELLSPTNSDGYAKVRMGLVQVTEISGKASASQLSEILMASGGKIHGELNVRAHNITSVPHR